MRKIVAFFALTMFIGIALQAQKPTRYSQYMFNGLSLNPAYAGSHDGTSFQGFFRQQWGAIEGAPENIFISFDTRSRKWDRVGIGFYLENDRLGLTNLFNGMATFSYSIPTDNGTFSAGLQGGMQYFQSDLVGLRAIVSEGGVVDQGLIDNSGVLTQPNFGAGIYYQQEDAWYIGASVPYLIERGNFYDQSAENKVVNQTLEILLTGGYVMHLSDGLDFKPTTLVKLFPNSDVGPVQFDISTNFFIKETFWIGATARFNQGVTPESTVLTLASDFENGLRLGYAFDYSFGGDRASIYTSSHEVMAGYDLSRGSRKGPRYF